ncbi:aminodeoxychorismate/anthranilate synthase component II [Alteromonas sp. 1_MG-2023]|uniref:anthranilate synthase component II n=1 Tax=Alteromonas sp. 1_MG-2023 TaxID=3062669 RepID=UPI0026E1CB3B|nr:aminodeoxychorismate/anthranilate synthase component II [Alteromonas sp. 1_MG-2023]MDO6473821.1 aminodeoxychorismate/anthranilate synthase component II [Alteromonas sp. 1_MG-2023]
MLLLIDNFDSFTHNLARYFTELGQQVKVVRNDEISLEQIAALAPQYLVLSPGPCTPDEAGITLSAIDHFAGKIPMLGVCLGHQSIGQVFGGKVTRADKVRHGKTSALYHNNTGMFSDLPDGYTVTRYHSLVLEPETLPDSLSVEAWCINKSGQREIMAIAHRTLPLWGVQFHPESLLTEHGHAILQRFITLADA